jgi:hypothetical protein
MLFSSLQLFAQKEKMMDPKMIEVIKSKKVAFITEQIGLTTQESQKFWPVYDKLDKERTELFNHRREMEEATDDKAVKSEEFYRKLSNEIVAAHVKEGKLMEEYNAKFLSILSAEKVVKLYRSERKFRSYLMHEMRKNDEGKEKK